MKVLTQKNQHTILITYCLKHINKKNDEELYRIFFYDCKPLKKKAHYPYTQKALDLSKSPTYKEREELHEHLISKPCLALRLGYLDEKNARWVIRDQEKEKKLFNRRISIEKFQNDDFIYHAKQKGVDIKSHRHFQNTNKDVYFAFEISSHG